MKIIPKKYIAIKLDNNKPKEYPIAVAIQEEYIVLSSKELEIEE